MPYRADVDGMRSIAVLLVLVFHFNLFNLGSGGFVGVDIFFVISGFLITTIVWRDLSKSAFSLSHFYAQRIRRLAPALITVQLAAIAIAAVFFMPSETIALGKESLAAQLYVSNIFYWRSVNYFAINANGSFMLHTWSLAVEEQFYLFFPCILIVTYRYARHRVVAVLALLALVSFTLNLAMVDHKPEATFYLLPTRAWEMLLGALLSRFHTQITGLNVLRKAAGPAALALIGIALWIYSPVTPFPGWYALLPVAASALLIIAGTGEGSPLSRALSTPVPVFIGRISYPLYLVHWPINIFASTLLPEYGFAARWAMFALSIASATAIYRGVELPLRRGSLLRIDRRVFAIYAATTGAVVLFSASMWLSGGWRPRFSPEVLQVADVAGTFDPIEEGLDYGGGSADQWLRPVGHKGAPVRWLIWGDSHAGALAQATSIWLNQRGEAGVVAYHHGCMPVVDTGNASCRRFNQAVLSHLQNHKEIAAVLLVSIWRQPLEPGFTDAAGDAVSGSEAVLAFNQAFHATLAKLRYLGLKAYVWEPLPVMAGNVPTRMARDMVFGNYWPLTASKRDHLSSFRFLYAALDKNAPLIERRIYSAQAICGGQTCDASHLGMPLFEDSNHPAQDQAPYFAAIMANDLRLVPPMRDPRH